MQKVELTPGADRETRMADVEPPFIRCHGDDITVRYPIHGALPERPSG